MRRTTRWLATALVLSCSQAMAHKASDSYLSVQVERDRIELRLDLDLLDLEHALGLDVDGDGDITWGELQRGQRGIESYSLSRLTATTEDGACELEPRPHDGLASSGPRIAIVDHNGAAHGALTMDVQCPAGAGTLRLDYRLLFDVDPLHRALVKFEHDGEVQTRALSPAEPAVTFKLERGNALATAVDFFREGAWHVWTGSDHMLFLLTLLLPILLRTRHIPQASNHGFAAAGLDVIKLVTAFTVSHALTLVPATLGWISLPGPLVESAIAATVLVVAVANMVPGWNAHRLPLVFGFGLVHGLGFAVVLGELELPAQSLCVALGAFNVGVEAGQLCVVAGFAMPLWLLSQCPAGAQLTLRYGSLAAAATACVWLFERSLGFAFISA